MANTSPDEQCRPPGFSGLGSIGHSKMQSCRLCLKAFKVSGHKPEANFAGGDCNGHARLSWVRLPKLSDAHIA